MNFLGIPLSSQSLNWMPVSCSMVTVKNIRRRSSAVDLVVFYHERVNFQLKTLTIHDSVFDVVVVELQTALERRTTLAGTIQC